MSNKLTTLAWKTSLGNAPAKAVLVRLADCANDEGYCWPGVPYIAQQTELNERTVRRVIEILRMICIVENAVPRDSTHKRPLQINLSLLGQDISDLFSREHAAARHKPVSETEEAVCETTQPVSETEEAVCETKPSHSLKGVTIIEASVEPSLNLQLALVPSEPASQSREVDVEMIYRSYPRKVKKVRALKAIRAAIERLGKDEGKFTAEEAQDFLISAASEYSNARRGQDKQFTPYPDTWFNESRYLEDPEEWWSERKGAANVKQNRTERGLENSFAAAHLIAKQNLAIDHHRRGGKAGTFDGPTIEGFPGECLAARV